MKEIRVKAFKIAGRSKAGKDTFADICVELLSRNKQNFIIKKNYAEELKRYVAEQFGADFNRLMVDLPYKEDWRKTLIDVSNDMRRTNPYIWVDKVFDIVSPRFAQEFKEFHSQAIFFNPDTRYFNELDSIPDYQHMDIKVIYEDIPIYIWINDETAKHRTRDFYEWKLLGLDRSERELRPDTFGFKYIVSNNASIESLTNIAKAILQEEGLYQIY